MRTKKFIGIMVMLMTLVSVAAYSSENDDNPGSDNANPIESLYGEWWLVGWNDKGIWLEVDTNYVSHQHMSIEIPEEGLAMAYSMVNEIVLGELTVNGNELLFNGGGGHTEVWGDIMENEFFEDYICNVKSYQLEGNLLKLYYSDKDYFVFTKDFDSSEEHFYEWKNGPLDSFIGEVTAVSEGEVEVMIVHSPSYVIFYSRTAPPMSNHDICHFAASELAGQSFEVGEKVAFRIVQFKNLKVDLEVEKRREYQLKVEPCKGSERISSRTGTVHNDKRMGWIIIDDEVNERQGGIYYYPLTLAEEFLTEGQPVVFSGELYPTWRMPWDTEGNPDCYYLDIDTIKFSQDANPTEIDGLKYQLLPNHTAMMVNDNQWEGELTSQTFNLNGHRVTGTPHHGIYIRNGKKVLVK